MSEFSKKDVSTILYVRNLIHRYKQIGAFAVGIATGVFFTHPDITPFTSSTSVYAVTGLVLVLAGAIAYYGVPVVIKRRISDHIREDVGAEPSEVLD